MIPTVAVSIAVDTAYIAAQASNGFVTSGIYMFDNMLAHGSGQEGTLGLHTVCNVGQLVGFRCVPIDAEQSLGDVVVIKSFLTVSGNVFTGAGHPVQQPPLGADPAGSYWVGEAMLAGKEQYTIQVEVTTGVLQKVSYYVQWNATITAS